MEVVSLADIAVAAAVGEDGAVDDDIYEGVDSVDGDCSFLTLRECWSEYLTCLDRNIFVLNDMAHILQ